MEKSTSTVQLRRAPGPGRVLQSLLSGTARTRSELIEDTGLSRVTLNLHLGRLLKSDLVREFPQGFSSGGRPARALAFNPSFGVVLVADVGETYTRVALTDLATNLLAEHASPLDVGAGPEVVLDWIVGQAPHLLEAAGRSPHDLVGVGLSLPAPVDFAASKVVGPSVMTGWDNFDVTAYIRRTLDVPVIADNDVNVLALAEARGTCRDVDYLFYVKVGTGVGSGIVIKGDVYRGAQGAAGDIGHVQLDGHGNPPCRCGNLGCVEALAAGWALVRTLQAEGFAVKSTRDVHDLAKRGQPEVIRLLRAAGRHLGTAISDVVSVLNPSVVVLGGTLGGGSDHLVTGVRELVYRRVLPLATRELGIRTSTLDELGGVIGASHLITEVVLAPDAVDQRLLAPD